MFFWCSAPCVNFGSGAAARVERKLFFGVVAAVEAEAVPLAVGGALQLLQQEDDGVMDDTQDALAAHHA